MGSKFSRESKKTENGTFIDATKQPSGINITYIDRDFGLQHRARRSLEPLQMRFRVLFSDWVDMKSAKERLVEHKQKISRCNIENVVEIDDSLTFTVDMIVNSQQAIRSIKQELDSIFDRDVYVKLGNRYYPFDTRLINAYYAYIEGDDDDNHNNRRHSFII